MLALLLLGTLPLPELAALEHGEGTAERAKEIPRRDLALGEMRQDGDYDLPLQPLEPVGFAQ